jgi:hypothetical protein
MSDHQTASPEYEGRGTARSNPAYQLRYKTIRSTIRVTVTTGKLVEHPQKLAPVGAGCRSPSRGRCSGCCIRRREKFDVTG